MGAARFPKLLAGFENPSGRSWCWPLIVWLVVPDRYCDRDRSTRHRFPGYGVPTPISECLEGYIGPPDRDIRFCQPVVDLPINRQSVCAGEGLDLHASSKKRASVRRQPGLSFARNQPSLCRADHRPSIAQVGGNGRLSWRPLSFQTKRTCRLLAHSVDLLPYSNLVAFGAKRTLGPDFEHTP